MEEITVSIPSWIDKLPKQDQSRARARFLLRLAAVMITEEGTFAALSSAIGLNRNSLITMINAGTMDNGVPVKIIKAVEQKVGAGVIPRRLLNPEVYGDM